MKKLFLLVLLIDFCYTYSQETTGSIEGVVTDSNNSNIEYATVLITDLDTNYRYGGSSNKFGHYQINNIPPGNNYQIEVSFIGYATQTISSIEVNLGKTSTFDFILSEEENSLEEVVLNANRSSYKDGNENTISRNQIKSTPTINRSIQDLTKNLPEANLNSFGGASNRFNNLNIDGIANNDVVGFQEPASGAAGSAANGSPGSLSRSQSISFGAIKELSVKTSPFDVSIGNFTGANINVITKNGTNTFKSELYTYGNNQNIIGQYAEGIKQDVNNFYDVQFGGSIGGAIKKDKLFYFINVEQALSKTPLLNAPGSNSSNISLSTINSIVDALETKYQYSPGNYLDASVKTSSTKLFFRLDYNLSDKHKITFRNNFVKSFADNLEWNESIFNFGNQGYRHNSITNSLSAELNSRFNNNTSNLFSLGFNKVKEDRDFGGRIFPHIEIADASNRIFAGTYREASIYNTNLNTFQLSNKFTYNKNKHKVTVGAIAQYNNIDYGFLTAWNGRWQYRSVDDFINDRPSRIRGVYHINNNTYNFVNNTPSATLDILTTGLYVQDKIKFSNKLSLIAGLRLDSQYLLDELPISDEVTNTPEFSHFTNKINSKPHINPRLHINYYPFNHKKIKVRAGSGLFTGRIPYLWFAYAEYISGTNYFNIDLRPTTPTPLVENLGSLASQQPNLTEINLIDNDFDLPREWKSNIAFEFKLPYKFDLTLEGTYSKVLKGIYFKSINRRNEFNHYSGADNRAYYADTGDNIKVNPNFTNVFLLTNTNEGYRYNFTVGLTKKLKKYNGYVGYTYGKSMDLSSTVRNSSAANFEWNQAINSNNPNLSYSNFDLRHKIVSTHSYDLAIGKKGALRSSLFFTSTSGSPFSFIYQGDVNRDGSSKNDLIYIPRNENEINLVDITDSNGNVTTTAAQQWINLNNYIEQNDYLSKNRGRYAERNGAKTPWNHQLDMKLEYNLDVLKNDRISLSLDVFNVLNLMNKNWGRLVYVPNVVNSSFSLLEFKGIVNNQPTYQFNVSDNTPWVVDSQNSRWRAQIGLKYQF